MTFVPASCAQPVEVRTARRAHVEDPTRPFCVTGGIFDPGFYQMITPPFVTFAVAGGQNVVDALRNHAA